MAEEIAAALRVVNEPTNGESFPENIIAHKPEFVCCKESLFRHDYPLTDSQYAECRKWHNDAVLRVGLTCFAISDSCNMTVEASRPQDAGQLPERCQSLQGARRLCFSGQPACQCCPPPECGRTGVHEMNEGSELYQTLLCAVLYALMELVKGVDGDEGAAPPGCQRAWLLRPGAHGLLIELAGHLAGKLASAGAGGVDVGAAVLRNGMPRRQDAKKNA